MPSDLGSADYRTLSVLVILITWLMYMAYGQNMQTAGATGSYRTHSLPGSLDVAVCPR